MDQVVTNVNVVTTLGVLRPRTKEHVKDLDPFHALFGLGKSPSLFYLPILCMRNMYSSVVTKPVA
jgi:hypothetical protein